MVGKGVVQRAQTLAAAIAVLVAVVALLLVVGGAGDASANGAGADPSDFYAEGPVVSIAGAPGELSGVAVNADGDVFGVDDNGSFVALTESGGSWTGSTVWDPWQRLVGRDLEGVTWITDDFYAIAFELAPSNSSLSAVQVMELRPWGNTQYLLPIGSTITLPNISASGNTGLQGIVHSPAESDASTWVFYAVEEDAPSLWRIDFDIANRTATTSPSGLPIAATDLAGIAIPAEDPNSIFVLSDSAKEITKFSLPGGQALPAAGSLDVATFNDPEGLAFFEDTLYVIGEGSQIATYAADSDPVGGADPSEYAADGPVGPISNAPGELSGIAVDDDGKVFAVDDNGALVRLFESGGTWSSTSIWDPWQRLVGRDLEGLTWIKDDYYAVALELAPSNSSQSALQIIELRPWGANHYIAPIGSTIALPNISASSNTGLQGIVYSPADSTNSTWVFYAVEEDAPSLWRIDYDVATRTATTSPSGLPIAANDLAGIAIPPADPNSIFVLSDSAKEITKFSLPGGQALPAAGSLDVSTFNDPEGLAFLGNTLYVVGEGSQIATYTPDGAVVGIVLDSITLAGSVATAPGPILPAGTAALEFTITNTGDVDLTNVSITDLGASSCQSPSNNQLPGQLVDLLAVGETVPCAVLVTLVDPAVSPVDFDITADGGGQPAADAGQYYYRSPEADVTLSNIQLDGQAAGSAPGPVAQGATASLTFTIQNTGDIALTVPTTSPSSSCVGAQLAVNATQTCTSNSPVSTAAPIPQGGVPISVTAVGGGQTTGDTGAYFYQPPAPSVTLSGIELFGQQAQSAPGPIAQAPSGVLTFTVQNTGPVGITVQSTSPASSCQGATLAPVAIVTCTSNSPVPTNVSIPQGGVPISVTAVAGGQTVTDGGAYFFRFPEVTLGGIALDGQAAGSSPGPVAQGPTSSLTFTVENTGTANVTIQSTSPASSCAGAPLAVNATLTCTSDSPVPTAGPIPQGGVPISVSALAAGQTVSDTGAYFYQVVTGTVVINEIETQSPDWVELYNPSNVAVDLTGWTITDDNPGGNGNTIPLNITLQPGAYVSYETVNPPAWDFGFSNGGDAATLRDANGVVVSEYVWNTTASNSWGLCPDGNGGLVYADTENETRDGPNDCVPPVLGVWPGSASVTIDDVGGTFSDGDLSGLDFAPNGDLWAAIDGGALYRLEENAAGNWTLGDNFPIDFPSTNPFGVVDAEGLTFAGDASTIYVVSERDNRPGQSGTSLNTVLSYELNAAGIPVIDEQWDLTNVLGNAATLPPTASNDGLEGITWVPDGFLTQNGFFDANQSQAYNPNAYDAHTGGVFFVAIEDATAGTNLFGYVLEDDGDFFQVAAIDIDDIVSFMAMEFDADTGELWAMCDNACNGATVVMALDSQTGLFEEVARYAPPVNGGAAGVLMENLNNEAFALAPTSECSGGERPAYWGEDVGNPPNNVQSLREGALTRGC